MLDIHLYKSLTKNNKMGFHYSIGRAIGDIRVNASIFFVIDSERNQAVKGDSRRV